jgi:hypothetical protein
MAPVGFFSMAVNLPSCRALGVADDCTPSAIIAACLQFGLVVSATLRGF